MNINFKKSHRYFVDFVLLVVASYFVIRKSTNFSASQFIEQVFQPSIGDVIVEFLIFVVGYALIAHLVIYTIDHFKSSEIHSLCFPHYRCLLNNNEINGVRAL
jgi:hypothetical protein